ILCGYIILGMFMDQIAILVLTVPIVLPLIKVLGFDPLWFGIIKIVTAEVGMIAPTDLGPSIQLLKKRISSSKRRAIRAEKLMSHILSLRKQRPKRHAGYTIWMKHGVSWATPVRAARSVSQGIKKALHPREEAR
ncbi:MAG: TRAP transporter large permease subunit, partial [Hoeflea sp.]|nr:TRAP transporter large permease subunit [Hoeflea sp.]